MIFIDETWGLDAATDRRPKAGVCGSASRTGTGKTTTFVAGLRMTGTVANATRPDQRVLFQAYIEQILAPELRLGDIVAMDNLGIHKSVAVCHAIEAAGAQLLYLPALEPVVQFVVKIALQLPSRPDSTLDIN